MTTPASVAPRFVAFSTIDDEPWEAGAEAGALLDRVRELASVGIGLLRFTEILDCGDQADDVLSEATPLPEARARFRTVFRGEGVPRPGPVDPLWEAMLSAEPESEPVRLRAPKTEGSP